MPGPLPRAKSNDWWNRRWAYRIFLLRELSAFAVVAYMVVLLMLVQSTRDGDQSFIETLDHPAMIALHAVVFLFALLHTVTWFRALPKGLALKLGGRPVPEHLVILGAYAALVVASIVLLALFMVEW
ncbi:MAG: hypothetical protein F4056_00820 [Chloroflexi bacterium]|nr:hypothetical protein [Chloroflexota bacterium]